jgi:hypothetical protein
MTALRTLPTILAVTIALPLSTQALQAQERERTITGRTFPHRSHSRSRPWAAGPRSGGYSRKWKRGSLVAYEAQVQTSGKHSENQVGPAGEPLAHEE